MYYLAVAVGGAMGSVLRYWITSSIHTRFNIYFPMGTLVVNVIGSLLIGLFFTILYQKLNGNELIKSLVMVGLLGGFTTFSAFSIETFNLIHSGFWFKALLNIILSVSLCIFSAFLGIMLGRLLLNN